VTGKSQSQLGFTSWFQHIWRFDFNYKDSIQKSKIQLEIWLKIFEIRDKDEYIDSISGVTDMFLLLFS